MKILPRRRFIITRTWTGTMGGKHQNGYYKQGNIKEPGLYHRYWPAYTYKLIEVKIR